MQCLSCGADCPDSALSCTSCGRSMGEGQVATQERAQDVWEYEEITIPLNLRSSQRDFVRVYDQAVRTRLQLIAPDGWHPAEPIDWGETWGSGRVKRANRGPWYRRLPIRDRGFHWESVTIRVKRRVEG